jgi:hypothetical protein
MADTFPSLESHETRNRILDGWGNSGKEHYVNPLTNLPETGKVFVVDTVMDTGCSCKKFTPYKSLGEKE